MKLRRCNTQQVAEQRCTLIGREMILRERRVNLSLCWCGPNGIVQGVVYTVTGITESHAALTMNTEYQTQSEPHEDSPEDAPDSDVAEAPINTTVPISDVPNILRLTQAMCYFAVQGRTLRNKRTLLLDTEHTRFSRIALIIGLSRATIANLVSIATK